MRPCKQCKPNADGVCVVCNNIVEEGRDTVLKMKVTCDSKIVMTLHGVSAIDDDVLDAEVLMVFRMEGDLETWAVDPSITDEQAIAEVKRYYHESYGWDMNSPAFDFKKTVKFYLRRRP